MELEKRSKINCSRKFVFYRTPQNIIDWFNSYGIKGKNIEEFDSQAVKYKVVCGTKIPLHVASFAWKAIELNLRNTLNKPYDELTVDEIDKLWHQVRIYDAKSRRVFFNDEDWEKNVEGFTVLTNLAHQATVTLLDSNIISLDQFDEVEQKIFDDFIKEGLTL